MQEEFENTKGVIRIRISKNDRQQNDLKKKEKQQSTSTLHTKVNIKQHESHHKHGVSSGATYYLPVESYTYLYMSYRTTSGVSNNYMK